MRARHRLPPGTPVALETGTIAFFVARQLAVIGLVPQMVDAHEVRLKATGRRRRVTGATRWSSVRTCGAGATARSSVHARRSPSGALHLSRATAGPCDDDVSAPGMTAVVPVRR